MRKIVYFFFLLALTIGLFTTVSFSGKPIPDVTGNYKGQFTRFHQDPPSVQTHEAWITIEGQEGPHFWGRVAVRLTPDGEWQCADYLNGAVSDENTLYYVSSASPDTPGPMFIVKFIEKPTKKLETIGLRPYGGGTTVGSYEYVDSNLLPVHPCNQQ